MKKILEKNFNLENVLKTINCKGDNERFLLYKLTLTDVIAEDLNNIDPFAIYSTIENEKEKIVSVILSLGTEIDKRIKYYFETSQYLEGMLLTILGDEILNCSKNEFESFFKTENFNIEQIENSKNEKIFELLINECKENNIFLDENDNFSPSKTVGYLYFSNK